MHVLIFYSVVPAQIRSLVGEAEKGRWLGGMVAVGAGMYLILKQDTNNWITKMVHSSQLTGNFITSM